MGLIAGIRVNNNISCLLKQTKIKKKESCVLYLLLFCLLSPLKTIESNWRCGRHSLQRIHCRSETSKGVYCLQYDDQKIVSGLRDNTIKVRTLQNGMLMALNQSVFSNLAFSFTHLIPHT